EGARRAYQREAASRRQGLELPGAFCCGLPLCADEGGVVLFLLFSGHEENDDQGDQGEAAGDEEKGRTKKAFFLRQPQADQVMHDKTSFLATATGGLELRRTGSRSMLRGCNGCAEARERFG